MLQFGTAEQTEMLVLVVLVLLLVVVVLVVVMLVVVVVLLVVVVLGVVLLVWLQCLKAIEIGLMKIQSRPLQRLT